MKRTIGRILYFIRNPKYVSYSNAISGYKWKLFSHILVLCLVLGILTSMFTSILLEVILKIDLGGHEMEELLANSPLLLVFFLAVVVAPFFEELFFRGGLSLFKNNPNFKWIFYTSAVLFALVHITNFESSTTVYLLTPLLVLPQLILGLLLGYIRVRLGLHWSMLLHACYNGILFLPVVILQLLGIPIE